MVRKRNKKEKIHHINHIKTDNRIENLELIINQSEHIKKYHLDTFRWHSWSKDEIECLITNYNKMRKKDLVKLLPKRTYRGIIMKMFNLKLLV